MKVEDKDHLEELREEFKTFKGKHIIIQSLPCGRDKCVGCGQC